MVALPIYGKESMNLVISQSHENRRLIEDIAGVFIDRAKAEEKYANALDKFAAQFQKLCKSKYLPLPLFVSQISTKAQLCKGYVTQINEDIVPALKGLVT